MDTRFFFGLLLLFLIDSFAEVNMAARTGYVVSKTFQGKCTYRRNGECKSTCRKEGHLSGECDPATLVCVCKYKKTQPPRRIPWPRRRKPKPPKREPPPPPPGGGDGDGDGDGGGGGGGGGGGDGDYPPEAIPTSSTNVDGVAHFNK